MLQYNSKGRKHFIEVLLELELEIVDEILLETLSFYEWQNLEKTLISLNAKDLVLIETLTLDELKQSMHRLLSRGMLEKKIVNKEIFYKRVSGKKSILKKVMMLFNLKKQ